MAVRWSAAALEDRESMLEAAQRQAVLQRNPTVMISALSTDERIRNEAKHLDGPAIYIYDARSNAHLYTTQDGRFVLTYRRIRNVRGGITATILNVWPSASDWPLTSKRAKWLGCRTGLRHQPLSAPSSGSLAA